MTASDLVIIATAVGLTALMSWYFFGPTRYHQAELDDGFQVIKVTVTGGYSPNVIQVRPGTPVRLLFDRQESGDCSSRVVIPDFTVNQVLPAVETTSVELVPEMAGEYEFACGMSKIHGKVRAVGETATPDSRAAASAAPLAVAQSVALDLRSDHIAYCVVDAGRISGAEQETKFKEASDANARLVRS